MKFKETPFGTEIIGLDKALNQVGREGLLGLEIERLHARIEELEAENERLRNERIAFIEAEKSVWGDWIVR